MSKKGACRKISKGRRICLFNAQARYVAEQHKNPKDFHMIKIYGTEICSFCLRAKRLAENYNLDYVWLDADDNREELEELVPGYKTIPQIFWHDKHVGGYEEFAAEIENTSGGFGEGTL